MRLRWVLLVSLFGLFFFAGYLSARPKVYSVKGELVWNAGGFTGKPEPYRTCMDISLPTDYMPFCYCTVKRGWP